MATLNDIEQKTKAFSEAWDRMGDTLRDLNDKHEQLNKMYLPGLKIQERILEERRHALKAALETSPELFTKPRSVVMHGFKVGLQKGKGKLSWTKKAAGKIVALIKKQHPDKADVLIRTVEEPNKDTLRTLPAAELMKLGIKVGGTGDEAVIEPVESNIGKLMKLYLKHSDPKSGEEEAA